MDLAYQSDAEIHALIEGYVNDVLAGKRVVGKLERLAVERFVRDCDRAAKGDGFRLNVELGLEACRLATQFVRHWKPAEWAGRPFRFCRQSAWQAFILFCLFGFERWHEDRHNWERAFNIAYTSVARKQGKSVLAAIIAFLMVFLQGEVAPEAYFIAPKQEQAKTCWSWLKNIINNCPDDYFRRQVDIQDYKVNMDMADGGVIKALGWNPRTFDSFSPSIVTLDEVHAMRNREAYDRMRSGTGARAGWLMNCITTRGDEQEGICEALDSYSQQVLRGVFEDDSHFAYIACLDEKDDRFDEAAWPKACPNLGVSTGLQDMRNKARAARNDFKNVPEFEQKQCNRWTSGVTAWLDLELWDSCRHVGSSGRPESIDWNALRAEPCITAVDMGLIHDFAAAVDVFPRPNGEYWIRPTYWIPSDNIAKRKENDQAPVQEWVNRGYVAATHGQVTDQDAVKQHIVNNYDRFDLRAIPFDRAYAAKLLTELEGMGLPYEAFPQTYAQMDNALRETEALIRTRRLVHDGHPVLRWNVSNAAVKENATKQRMLRKTKDYKRIDGAVAMAMGVFTALVEQQTGSAAIVAAGSPSA